MDTRRALIAATAIAALLVPASAAARPHPGGKSAKPTERFTITRDSRGEPHVSGDSLRATTYGFGYAQMEDQGTYILQNLATSTGRSAELLGPDCLPGCLRSDHLVHLFRIPESATEQYSGLPSSAKEAVGGFTDGINAFIADHPDQVPSWSFPLTPADVLASIEYRFVMSQVSDAAGIAVSDDSSGTDSAGSADVAPREIGRALGAGTVASAARGAGEVDQGASNMFAVNGSRTATGSPVLEGNPHLGFDGLSRWYMAQLQWPGTRVQGSTFRGLPGIAMGSNGHVAWANTANHGTQNETDVYVEQLNAANANQYLFGGSYRNMDVVHSTLKAQTSPGAVQEIPVTYRYTVHGPVLSDPITTTAGQAAPTGAIAVSAQISQFEQTGLATQMLALDQAHNLNEFRAGLAHNQVSGFNFVAADGDGIFYAAGSRSGILADGLDPNAPLDGTDPATQWQGILPFEDVPQAADPPSGYFQNANNGPLFSAPDQITADSIPTYLRGQGDTPRSKRQVDLLTGVSGFTLGDAERFGLDAFVQSSPGLQALLAQTAARPGADPAVVAANAIIAPWDGRAVAGSDAVALFATWVRGLERSALGFPPNSPPPPTTSFSNAAKDEASRAMIVAYEGMVDQYGTAAVPYGSLHRFEYGSASGGVDGGDVNIETLRLTTCKGLPGASSPSYYHSCVAKGGSGFMFNVDLASGRMTVMRPVSDTADPSDPTYSLNAADYLANTYREFPITKAQVDAERTSQQTLKVPAKRRMLFRSHRSRVDGRGRVRVKLACRLEGQRCRGKVKLRARAGRKRSLTLGTAKFSIKAGKTRNVKVKLTRAGRHALGRKGRINAEAAVSVGAERSRKQRLEGHLKLRI